MPDIVTILIILVIIYAAYKVLSFVRSAFFRIIGLIGTLLTIWRLSLLFN